MKTAQALFDGLRTQAPALLRAVDDPHAELLALVWGPRFDREHAQSLLAGRGLAVQAAQTLQAAQALQAIQAAADSFDRLPAPRQQRLRQLILQHRRGAARAAWAHAPVGQSAPCTASC